MRFSVDAHAIGCHLTGNEVYIRNLIAAFAELDKNSEFIAYVALDEAAGCVPPGFLRRSVARNPFVRLGYDLSRHLRRDRPELVHVQYTAPLACPVPVVVSVHDVSFLEHPEFFTRWRAAQLRLTVRRTVQSAARILTVSEFSRKAIAEAYCLDPETITVIPNAASPVFRELPGDAARRWVSSRFGVRTPFILTVGDLQPRKNHAGLIRSFAELVRAHPEIKHDLVIAGKQTWHGPRVHKAAAESGAAERIRFTGFVSDEELVQLYNACEFLVFPSFYEGFGLPVIEAMACGRAVACSATSALPEVANGAALMFDPRSTREMVKAIGELARNSELRARNERLGLERAARFSWRNAASRTLEVYYEVAARRAHSADFRCQSASV